MHERTYQLGNVDITIIAQQPKLSPHKEKMRDQLCHLLGSHPSTVNIKVSAVELLAVVLLHFDLFLSLTSFILSLLWSICGRAMLTAFALIWLCVPWGLLDLMACLTQAKTHEKVDSLGENRSIACHTVCTLILQNWSNLGCESNGMVRVMLQISASLDALLLLVYMLQWSILPECEMRLWKLNLQGRSQLWICSHSTKRVVCQGFIPVFWLDESTWPLAYTG